MHMADALISPVVGGTMIAATASITAYSIKKIKNELDQKKIPLMGVMGAFIFAAQMINFSIPGTGSSGHLGGGMILSILLGPYAGFLAMASILIIQALFFADGGLLALGCNIFNLGFFTCFIVYPFIYKKIIGKEYSAGKIIIASMISAIIGLQLGAFSVVLETLFSGKTELPFATFVLLMQPIHLAIGIVEGMITSAVVAFVWKSRSEIIEKAAINQPLADIRIKKVLIGLIIAAVITGGILSWFASTHPDGLEWSMFKTSGKEELESSGEIHKKLSDVQNKTAFMPDYGFKQDENVQGGETASESWPSVSAGTSTAGLIGGAMTLILAGITGFGISIFKRKKQTEEG